MCGGWGSRDSIHNPVDDSCGSNKFPFEEKPMKWNDSNRNLVVKINHIRQQGNMVVVFRLMFAR